MSLAGELEGRWPIGWSEGPGVPQSAKAEIGGFRFWAYHAPEPTFSLAFYGGIICSGMVFDSLDAAVEFLKGRIADIALDSATILKMEATELQQLEALWPIGWKTDDYEGDLIAGNEKGLCVLFSKGQITIFTTGPRWSNSDEVWTSPKGDSLPAAVAGAKAFLQAGRDDLELLGI